MTKRIIIILFTCLIFSTDSVLFTSMLKSFSLNDKLTPSDSLIINIKKLGWTDKYSDLYSRYIINNNISFELEAKKLKEIDSSFYTKYIFSLLLKKQMKYDKMFDELFSVYNQNINYFPYFDELVYSARASNKLDILFKNTVDKNFSFEKYVLSLIKYSEGNYLESLTYLNAFLQTNKSTPLIKYKLSYIYRNLGDYIKAFSYLNDINGDEWITGKMLLAKGSLYFLSGNYNEALNYYKMGYEIANKIRDEQTKATAIVNLAILDDMTGKTNLARNKFEEAQSLAAWMGDYEIKAFALSELGVSYSFTNELIEARENYIASFNIYKHTNNFLRLSLLANNIGKLYMQLFEYSSAINYYNDGVKFAGTNKRALAMNFLGIADAYTNLSNYSKALVYYKKAKDISSQIKELSLLAEINSGLGSLNFNINNKENALKYLNKSLEFYKNTNDIYSLADNFLKLGIVYSSLEKYDDALKAIKNSLQLSKRNNDFYTEALSLINLSDIYFIMNKITLSKQFLTLANSIINKNNFNYLNARSLILQGKILQQEKKYSRAYQNFLAANKIANNLKEYELQIEALFFIAKLNEITGKNREAENYYLKVNGLISNISNPLYLNKNVQITYYSGKESIYNSFADFLLKTGQYQKAFELIDNTRSRSTQQSLDILKFRSLITDQNVLNKFYDYNWIINSDIYNQVFKDSIKTKLNDLVSLLSNKMPSIEKLFKVKKPLSISQIQEKLSEDENIISVYSSKNKTYIFKLNKNGFNHYELDLSQTQITSLVSKISPYYNNSLNGLSIFNQDLFSFNTKASFNLYKKVLSVAIDNIPKGEKIIFSPSFDIQLFPIEFLVTKYDTSESNFNYSDKNFLIFDYSILHTSSIHTYLEQKENINYTNSNALVVGNPYINYKSDEFATRRTLFSKAAGLLPLKYSLQEIKEINGIIKVESVLEGKNATETLFKKNAGNKNLIHISTHSFLYDKQPVIYFSNENDKENDGYLELNEIVELNLNCDLVVLSSCNSGLGKIDQSEGVLGMTKAFFEAGTKSVMVSLWEVNDKYTARLMKYFYEYLNEGKLKSDALRLAKIKFIKNDSSNPYFWSAFVISGNNNPVKLESGLLIKNYSILVIGLLLITYMAVYLQIKKKNKTLSV